MRSRIAGRLAVALAAGALLSLAACSSAQDRFARHLESAQKFLDAGQTKEALLELRSALQIDPKNADVNFRIAEVLANTGKYADAAFFYHETSRLDPKRIDAMLAEAKLVMFDDRARADQLIDKVLELDPTNSTAYERRSEIALSANDADAGLKAALTAVELGPKDGLAQMQLGIVQQARIRLAQLKGEKPSDDLYQAAEAAFRKSDELYGGDSNPRIELGRLYAAWPGHAEQAEAAFRSGVEAAKVPLARGRAAGVVISYAQTSGNQELLRWALEQMTAAVPRNLDAWESLAEVAEQQKTGNGDAVYKRLLEQRADDEEAHVRYARFLDDHQRSADGLALLEAEGKSGSDPPVALEAIVELKIKAGDGKAARAVVDDMQRRYPDHPRTWRARGRLALAQGRYDEAAEALRHYVGLEQSHEGQRLLALAEAGRRNYPAAVAAVDAGLQIGNTPTPELLRLKLSILDSAGDYQQVLATTRRLQQGGPLTPTDRLLLARALYQTGRATGGRDLLVQLLSEPNPPLLAYIEYAFREGRTDPVKSREYLEHVLAESPRQQEALRLLVTMDVEAGKSDEALAQIDKAGEAGRLSPQILLLKAQVLASRKDYKGAEDAARRAFAAAPTLTPALDLLASIYTAENRLPEAVASFQEADKAGALPPSGQELLARLQLASGHRDEARALYERVVTARSDLPGAKNDLAFLLAEDDQQLDRALSLAQEAQQAEPENPEIVDTLGFVYHKKGLNQPAVEQFNYAIELSERANAPRADYPYHLGLALRALGKDAEAATAFERALKLDASFPHAADARRELEAAKVEAAKKTSAAAQSG